MRNEIWLISVIAILLKCLNPYSNGICSTSIIKRPLRKVALVLILILMEYALRVSLIMVLCSKEKRLNPYSNGICSTRTATFVTILALSAKSLNPYSNGICSTRDEMPIRTYVFAVLILILMEYALRA